MTSPISVFCPSKGLFSLFHSKSLHEALSILKALPAKYGIDKLSPYWNMQLKLTATQIFMKTLQQLRKRSTEFQFTWIPYILSRCSSGSNLADFSEKLKYVKWSFNTEKSQSARFQLEIPAHTVLSGRFRNLENFSRKLPSQISSPMGQFYHATISIKDGFFVVQQPGYLLHHASSEKHISKDTAG